MPQPYRKKLTLNIGTPRRVSTSAHRSGRARATSAARVFAIAAPQQPQPGPRRRYQKPEVKFTDTNMTGSWDASNAATNVLVVNQCSLGTGANQRIGNVVSCKSLELTGAVYGGTLQANSPQACRIIIYWDRQPDPAGVVTTIAPSLLLNALPQGLTNIQNTDRYVIIYDKIFTIGTNAAVVGTAGYNQARAFHLFLDLKGVETRYLTAGGATFPSTNSLCLAVMGDTLPGPNINPTWVNLAQSRVRFTDS